MYPCFCKNVKYKKKKRGEREGGIKNEGILVVEGKKKNTVKAERERNRKKEARKRKKRDKDKYKE